MSGPTNARFILAWINFINSITWNYRIYSCFIKNWEKSIKKSWNSKKIWKCIPKEKYDNKKFIKIGFLEWLEISKEK